MARVTSWGVAVAAALGIAACGESRSVQQAVGAASTCATCHSAPGEGRPFRDADGNVETFRQSVGAHEAHLHGNLGEVSCADCHRVPRQVGEPGHLEDSPDDVRFGPLARTGAVNPRYESLGCAATYCHGNFPNGRRDNRPAWLGGSAAATCGSCHAVPPTSGRHPEHRVAEVRCDECHGPFLSASHVNGAVNLTLTGYDERFKTCAQMCHLPRSWPAPGDEAR